MTRTFRARQKLDKYRIVRRLSDGPLATVYEASDTVLQKRVALKVPHLRTRQLADLTDEVNEARIASRLEHPNILTVLDARFVGDCFVIAMPLGQGSLADRMERRISSARAIDIALQSLRALAYAHEQGVIHCDIKPENFILFADNTLKLADFGFSKLARRTVRGSGSGTIHYIAPEQALGKPRFASDVFSLGLVLYRLFSGHLPEYPFDWPPAELERLVGRSNERFAAVLEQALNPDPRGRFSDAGIMLSAAQRAFGGARRQKSAAAASTKKSGPTWRRTRWREFSRLYGKSLRLNTNCRHCEGPVAMQMQACPWCGTNNPAAGSDRSMPAHCPRCERGVKLDWNYCAWCYGAGFEPETTRRYSDKRYVARCTNRACKQPLMAHMRYCPWCRTKIRRRWQMRKGDSSCRTCKQPVAREFWRYCAWCREQIGDR